MYKLEIEKSPYIYIYIYISRMLIFEDCYFLSPSDTLMSFLSICIGFSIILIFNAF